MGSCPTTAASLARRWHFGCFADGMSTPSLAPIAESKFVSAAAPDGRSYTIRRVDPQSPRDTAGLVDVLIDCVEGGASVSFMLPITTDKARAFWRKGLDSANRGERTVLVAESADGSIIGTVSILYDLPENQPHRADVAKMLVSRHARRRGIAAALLAAAESEATAAGKTLLVLDTVTGGDAERLYERCGWQRCGVIPNYALFPAGGYCATTVFYRQIGARPAGA
jgi:GNAT superfamily N-acetyltransferase